MTTPETPEEKKELQEVEILTIEERLAKLENLVNNAFNYLAKTTHEVDFRLQNQVQELQTEVSKTITLINMSVLQNIVMLRELIGILVKKEIVDLKEYQEVVNTELTKAIETQQQIIYNEQKAQEEAAAQAADPLAVDPTL